MDLRKGSTRSEECLVMRPKAATGCQSKAACSWKGDYRQRQLLAMEMSQMEGAARYWRNVSRYRHGRLVEVNSTHLGQQRCNGT